VIVLYAASKLSFGRSTNPENDKKKKETNKNPDYEVNYFIFFLPFDFPGNLLFTFSDFTNTNRT